MGLLITEQRKYIKEVGSRASAITESKKWYYQFMKNPDKTIVHTTERFKRGKIYIFYYPRPKTLDKMLIWDSHPVVLAMGQNKHGDDIGINLNFVPMTMRLHLMDLVMTAYKGKIKYAMKGKYANNASLQKPILELDYKRIERILYSIQFKYAVRAYKNILKSNQVVVSYDSWPKITFLDLRRLKFGNKK